MIHRRLGLAALVLIGCDRNNGNQRQDASSAAMDAAAVAPVVINNSPPENLLVLIRGATLRRAVPLLVPQAGAAEVLEQISRQVTPGIMDHGDEIDIDSPFAVAGIVTGTEESEMRYAVAWPLRPGMQIAQDARNRRGYRVVTEGLYAPTTADAGANADDQCWVAQRVPVGWMLICAPRTELPRLAGFLRDRASNAPDNAALLDIDVHAPIARRVFTRQLAEADRQAPPRAESGVEAVRRAMFEEARRGVALMSFIANDVDTLHGAITQDENAMHLRVEGLVGRVSSDATRALLAASAGRQAPSALLQSLPGAVSSWIVGGFDRTQIINAMGAPRLDPAMAAQAGPELARVMASVDEVKNLAPLGERVDAYSVEDGYTMYHVIRRPDAAQFVNDLRVAMNSIPARALPEGGSLRDVATAMPTPGLTGTNVLRVGRNVQIPPGVQVPPEVRAVIERSMLLVAEGDRLIAVMGRDPVGRYRAMSQGPRLAASVPANAVLAGRITPPAFAPLFYGAQVPGIPESHTTDGMDFALVVERRGEGARIELRGDAPIGAALELRTVYAMIQQAQERMAQQMMQQQQQRMQMMRQQQQQQQQMQRQGRPQLMLPPAPRFQLQAPQ